MSGNLVLNLRHSPKAHSLEQIEAVRSFPKACDRIADECGLNAKSIAFETDIDEAQLSKIRSGQAGISWEKLSRLMDVCGSELPLQWMLLQRGYDPTKLHKLESELERENRELREQLERKDSELAVITSFVRDVQKGAS